MFKTLSEFFLTWTNVLLVLIFIGFLKYGGKRYYQYNEDDFLFKFLLLTSFFRKTRLQVIKVKLFKLTAFLFSIFLCIHAV